MIGKLNDTDIEFVLQNNLLGRLGCNDGNKTFVYPVNYVFDGRHVYAHAVEGTKIRVMRKNPSVCLTVDDIKDQRNWKCVMLWGKYEEITDNRERYAAMKMFVDRTLRMKISETSIPPESAERSHPRSPGNILPVFYKIVITEKSGRYEQE